MTLVAASCSITCGQLPTATTIPLTSVDNPAVIAEVENASNVSLFCEIMDPGLVRNGWEIQRTSDPMPVTIVFNTTTLVGQNDLDNFIVARRQESVGLVFSNLTIRVFDTSLDNARLSCLTGIIVGTYILRIISKYITKTY